MEHTGLSDRASRSRGHRIDQQRQHDDPGTVRASDRPCRRLFDQQEPR